MMLVELDTPGTSSLPVRIFAGHLRLGTGFSDDGSEDELLEGYLRAALAAVELRLGKALLSRRFVWELTRWSCSDRLFLPIAPVQSIVALRIVDQSGVATLTDVSSLSLEKNSQRPVLNAGRSVLPPVPARGHVELEFTAGYGPDWTDVPADLRQAVLLLATDYYERRSAGEQATEAFPLSVASLLETHRALRGLGAVG
jgi:uncharacterized phiE125 gp8 family phage protein